MLPSIVNNVQFVTVYALEYGAKHCGLADKQNILLGIDGGLPAKYVPAESPAPETYS
ncbi:MAG TPA: hypothetical protein VEC17_02285 [Candidatus Binatia bacterium]|nr:hypothetical protein [Candidatus Binatia bacterium]